MAINLGYNWSIMLTIPTDPDEAIKVIDSMNIYNLFKCGVCGYPHNDHPETCSQYHNNYYYVGLCVIASSLKRYDHVFKLAYRNGFEKWWD